MVDCSRYKELLLILVRGKANIVIYSHFLVRYYYRVKAVMAKITEVIAFK